MLARHRTARSKYSSQRNRGSSPRAAWRGVDPPVRQSRQSRRQAQPASGTRQRRSMHMWQGRAAVRTPRGCPETKGGHAYLVMHQSTPGICSRLVFEALSFVRAAIIEEVEYATSTRARSRRAPVPWQACHEQAQRRSRQSQARPCTGAVAGGLTGRASIAFKICQSRSYFRTWQILKRRPSVLSR